MDEPSRASDTAQRLWQTRLGWRLPAGIALLAVVIRVLRWLQTPVMMNDGPIYLRLAQQISDGDWRSVLAYEFHPLYPLAVALARPVTGSFEQAAVGVSILASAVAVLGLFTLLRSAFDRNVAAIGALLLALHPIAIEEADVQSDPLYLAAFVWSAALLWRALCDRRARSALVAGLVTGVAYLVRPEGLGMLAVGIGVAAWQVVRRELPPAAAARLTTVLLLGASLAAGPYVAFISAHNGGFTLTGKKSVAGVLGIAALQTWVTRGTVDYKPPKPLDPLLAARPDLTPPARGVRPFRNAPVPTGFAKYPEAARRLARVTVKSARPEILILLAAGLFAARGRPRLRGRFFLTCTVLYGLMLLGLSANSDYVSRRHVLPVATLLFGYAALGVAAFGSALARVPGLHGRLTAPTASAGLLALIVVLAVGKSLGPDREDAVAERRAAEWIAAHGALAAGDAVAAVKQRVAYYARAPFVDLRRAPHPELLLPYLRRERARYVVVDADERAELERLVEREGDAIALRHEERDDHGVAFVYEVH